MKSRRSYILVIMLIYIVGISVDLLLNATGIGECAKYNDIKVGEEFLSGRDGYGPVAKIQQK